MRPKLISVAIPIVALASLFAFDWFGFSGRMPGWLYFGLIAAYLFGTFAQMLAMWVSISDTKRRMLSAAPQVWEERTVELKDEELVQTTETSRLLNAWSAVTSIERKQDMIFFWLANFSAIAVPLRAFASPEEADIFEGEGRRLAEGADRRGFAARQ